MSQESLVSEFFDGVFAMGLEVPVAFIHMCDSTVDDQNFVLGYLIVKHLCLFILRRACDIDRYIFSQYLRVHGLQERLGSKLGHIQGEAVVAFFYSALIDLGVDSGK